MCKVYTLNNKKMLQHQVVDETHIRNQNDLSILQHPICSHWTLPSENLVPMSQPPCWRLVFFLLDNNQNQTLSLGLVPMVPWAEVWSNWGVRQTRFMATITFFPVSYPPRQAQSSPKKPPLERWSEVKKFCSAVTSLFDFFIWLLASLVCVSPKFVHLF